MSSYHSAPAQRVPAWKRLGLKLKGPASGESPTASTGSTIANPSADHSNAVAGVKGSPASALKRKLPNSSTSQPTDAASVQTPNKRLRTEEQTPGSRKSVAFAEDTKDSPAAKVAKKNKPKKKTKKPAAEAPEKADTNLEPSLAYLRQWHTDRASWKFNKNYQTLLIKYLFDADKVPSTDIPVFYKYIRDLKGFIRTRLRETAAEIKKKDMEQGVAGFPAAAKDREDKQKAYDDLLVQFVKEQQQRLQQSGSSSSTNGNGKRSLDEVELAVRTADPEVKARLLKRMRAEMVLEELSDSESTTSTDTTTTTSSSSSSGKDTVPAPTPSVLEPQRTESQQPAKRRRLRNVRTDISDNDSSSESDSDDDDSDDSSSGGEDEDSSSSSSEEDEDEEMEVLPGRESSSSSSSSSSSGSDGAEGESSEDSDDEED